MLTIPRPLADPLRNRSGTYVRDLLLDLTAYLDTLSPDDLDTVVRWYQGFCPPNACRLYMIEDNTVFDSVANPALLTKSGVAARQAGDPLPFLASQRARITQGRRFSVQLWDGAQTGAWSLVVRAAHRRDTGWHPFIRLMVPVTSDPDTLVTAARYWADQLPIRSGHGAITFTYDPWFLDRAFNDIYALAKRFWGVEVEYLNGTLPLMTDRVKSVAWLTLLGKQFTSQSTIAADLTAVARRDARITVETRARATILKIGDEPVVGDQNRPDASLDGYYALASALEPVLLDDHPDFPGAFVNTADTAGWIRRFIDPKGWR